MKTCAEPTHVAAANEYNERPDATFAMKSMLKRPGSLLAVDPTTHLNADTGEVVDLEAIQNTDEQDREHEKARDGGIENAEEVQCDPREAHLRTRAMPKPCLSNCRTHNDQLMSKG